MPRRPATLPPILGEACLRCRCSTSTSPHSVTLGPNQVRELFATFTAEQWNLIRGHCCPRRPPAFGQSPPESIPAAEAVPHCVMRMVRPCKLYAIDP